jgi:EF hand
MSPPPLIAALDGDRDHSLSATEIAGAAAALAALAANGDGSLTRDELRPKPPEGQGPAGKPEGPPQAEPRGEPRGERPKRPAPPLIAALDTDRDGTISADEIKAAPESLKTLDKNGDGTISPDELGPEGPPRKGGRRGEGGPRGDHQGRPPGPPPAPDEDDAGQAE